jgi:hypothetical protein
MGGGQLIPKKVEKVVVVIIYLAIGLFALIVLSVWILLILGLMKILPFAGVSDPATALLVFAFSLTIVCAVLWAGAQTKVLAVSTKTQSKIWIALVAATLATIVSGIAKALK